jgi:uncharacterized protein
MPSVRFLILQPTPFCNISCKYCYLPHRSLKARMTPETITRIFSELFASGWVGEELDIVWHAGEPLTLPIDYYTQAFRTIARLAPDGTRIQHAFQTNGILIDDQWCQLFKEYDTTVGVSIDGPPEVHNASRVTRSGRATFSQTIAGIRCLRRNDVEFSVITVLSSASLGKARELHDFYLAEGIKNVCFNVEEIEGVNKSSSLVGREKEIEYENFIRQFWNLNVQSNGLFYIREFKNMLAKIIRPAEYVEIDNTLTQPFDHLNVDYEGNYSTFSPEFLGQENDYYGNFIIGNVWRNSLIESLQSQTYKRLNRDVAAGIELCRASCEYFSVCGGGSPINKLYENGSIASSETMYCRLNIKVVANIALEIIENSAEERGYVGSSPSCSDLSRQKAASYSQLNESSGKLRRSGISISGNGGTLLFETDGRDGSRVVVLTENSNDDLDRVEVSRGTILAPAHVRGRHYETGAIIPDQRWRILTASEREFVFVSAPPTHVGFGIGVTRLPPELLEPFSALQTAAGKARNEKDLDPLLRTAETREGTVAIVRHVRHCFGQRLATSRDEQIVNGIAVKPFGLPTVTVESQTGKLIGLHLDDWHSFRLGRRHLSPNRISVNLGCEDRFFIFVNVPLAQMNKELQRLGQKVHVRAGGTPIARAFMSLFPSYPVLRLRICPGEAYVAPTENIAHDVSSVEMSTMDVSLQIRGRFDIPSHAGSETV